MNDSSLHRRTSSKDYYNCKLYQSLNNHNTKKKAIPISINSNPSPGMFVFKNQLSNIVTSYKDISTKLQNKDKMRYAKKYNHNKANEGSKGSNTNQLVFNTYMSNNSKISFSSNQSIPLPMKNMTTNAFHKKIISNAGGNAPSITGGNCSNTMNMKKHSISVSKMKPCPMVIQVKTENVVNCDYKMKNTTKGKSWVSLDKITNGNKNGVSVGDDGRKKSMDIIGVVEMKGRKNKSYAQAQVQSKGNHNQRYQKITLSNIEERILHINQFNKKMDKLKAKMQNESNVLAKQKIKKAYANNVNNKFNKGKRNSYTNKIILMQTKEIGKALNDNKGAIRGKSRDEYKRNNNIYSNENVNDNCYNTEGVSNELIKKAQSTNPKTSIKLKEIIDSNPRPIDNHPIQNFSLFVGHSQPLDLLSSQIPPIPIIEAPTPIIQHKPITFNHPIKKPANPTYDIELLTEPHQDGNKKSSITEPNIHTNLLNINNDIINLEVVEDEPTERLFNDNFYQNNELLCNINPFSIDDFIPPLSDQDEAEIEDKFDDLNSIVRIIKFKSVKLDDISVFNSDENNKLYQNYETKFNNDYNTWFNHNKINKGSERKKMNVSLSTQESSYKKYLSPYH